MAKLKLFLTLLIDIFLFYNIFAQLTPFWGYQCTDEQCVRVEVNESNRDAVLGLHSCFLTCNEFGTLWPRPRNVVTWNNTLLSINRTNIQIRAINQPDHQLFWDSNVNRFNKILDAKLGNNQIIQHGPNGLFIEINVEIPSLELDVDTNEQYQLELSNVNSDLVVKINSQTYFGARHGFETLSQLIAYDEFSNQLKILSHVLIRDEPAYKHRGILLDTARRFYSVDSIKRTLDVMAMSKLNVFHWHITDSQSFAMVLNSHPELARKGAHSPSQVYVPSDIKDIVEFGLVRGVRIIPEFDAPSHVAEGFQNTNLVTCIHSQPWARYCSGPPCGQFDVTKDELYDLLHEIYLDMNEMFNYPPTFHMGGDEVHASCWNSSADVRAWMIDKGWGLTQNDYLKLWNYFQEKALSIYRNITSLDKKPIIWTSSLTEEDVVDEYLSPDDYVIQVWSEGIGPSSQIPHLLERGFDVIISNVDALYLDCGFGSWTGSGNNWCSPYKSWHLIYDNDFQRMAGNRTSQVLGGEVCSWSEPTDEGTIDARLWPRASAFGERLWTNPDTNYREAEYRILLHREFLVQYGIHAESIQPEWCVQNLGGCPYNY